jgi:hypothetical protein
LLRDAPEIEAMLKVNISQNKIAKENIQELG